MITFCLEKKLVAEVVGIKHTLVCVLQFKFVISLKIIHVNVNPMHVPCIGFTSMFVLSWILLIQMTWVYELFMERHLPKARWLDK